MASITFYNPESPLLFCGEQLLPESLDQLSKSPIYQQGLNHPRIMKYLQKCKYIKLLTALWGEKDPSKRHDWLEKHAGLHAPLMCERAIAIFVKDPTAKTITEVVLPLLEAATCRTVQDFKCCQDSTVMKDAYITIRKIYLEVLHKKMHQLTPHLSLAKIKSDQRELISQEKHKKVIEVLNQSIQSPDSLPSLSWVIEHALIRNREIMKLTEALNGDHSNTPPPSQMLPEGSWENIRITIAEKTIARLQRKPSNVS